MPIFEFRCKDCGEVFERLCLDAAEETDVECPRCGSKDVKKEFSAFACGLGGSGFGSCGPGGGFGFRFR